MWSRPLVQHVAYAATTCATLFASYKAVKFDQNRWKEFKDKYPHAEVPYKWQYVPLVGMVHLPMHPTEQEAQQLEAQGVQREMEAKNQARPGK